MNRRDAIDLIAGAIPARRPQTWADFGAGEGTFALALSDLLGAESRIFAVDRDADALASIEARANIITVVADFAKPIELPGLHTPLDGALFANSLHYMRDASAVLARLASMVAPDGRIVIIEYDRRGATRWVPYPIPLSKLSSLAAAAGLEPNIIATRPSMYAGELYVAVMDRA